MTDDDILQMLTAGGNPAQSQQMLADQLRSKQAVNDALKQARGDSSQYDILNFVAQNAHNPGLASGVQGLAAAAQARAKPQALGQTGIILGDQYMENPGYTEQKQADRETRMLTAAGQLSARKDALQQQEEARQERNSLLQQTLAMHASIAQQGLEVRRYMAGMGPDGQPDPQQSSTAAAIAAGKLPPPTGAAALMPRNQALMSKVLEINPNYDYAGVQARTKATKDFTSGPQANTMRSLATANNHLDQLSGLVTALDNGNTPLVNQIGNAYSRATGEDPVTNFNAAKEVVAKEVIKGLVNGGMGGVDERKNLSDSLNAAASPKQLNGVIKQYRTLLGAQHDNLVTQATTAGVDPKLLPTYVPPKATGAPQLDPATKALIDKYMQ